jgi:hypothetical protein
MSKRNGHAAKAARRAARVAAGRSPFNFDCEHCGKRVPWAMFRGEEKPRDHCPFCLWSKHVSIGAEAGYPPCGSMMEGTRTGELEYPGHPDSEIIERRCLGCGFTVSGPSDDYLMRVLASGERDSVTCSISGDRVGAAQ